MELAYENYEKIIAKLIRNKIGLNEMQSDIVLEEIPSMPFAGETTSEKST